MNVLEKILEEIEHEIMKNKEVGRKQCEGMARAMNIIRSHMDDVTDTNVPSNWIPCSEQLPEEDSFEYIISCSDGITRTGVSYGYAKDEDKEPCFYKYDDEYWNCYRYNNVVAWQPLPEPYRGGIK